MRPELEHRGHSNPLSKVQPAKGGICLPLRPPREMLYGRGTQREGRRVVFLFLSYFFLRQKSTLLMLRELGYSDDYEHRARVQLRLETSALYGFQEQSGLSWFPNPLDIYFHKSIAFSFLRDLGTPADSWNSSPRVVTKGAT